VSLPSEISLKNATRTEDMFV